MALIHRATLAPAKLELLSGWLPTRAWAWGPDEPGQVGAYRLDDPDGEVGLEGLVVTGTGGLLHVPVTYRAAPLPGADDQLIGTSEHSVLGTRWVYDACADPVWATALAAVVLTGGTQAEELVHADDGPATPRDPSMTVRGTGAAQQAGPPVREVSCADGSDRTVVTADGLELVVVRRIGLDLDLDGSEALTGRWHSGGAVLARVTRIEERP